MHQPSHQEVVHLAKYIWRAAPEGNYIIHHARYVLGVIVRDWLAVVQRLHQGER